MLPNRVSVLPALLVLLLAVTGIYYNSQRGLLADDDNLWLHFASEKIIDPPAGQAMEDRVLALVKQNEASQGSILRISARSSYHYNYALPVRTWHALGELLPQPQTIADYPSYIAAFLCLSMPATSLLAWLALVAVLVGLKRPDMWRATVAGLGLIAALMLLPNGQPMMTLLGFDTLHQGLRNFTAFVLNPWHGFSVYGFTPRNNLTVIVIAVFLLRWCGHMRLSYALMLPLFALHSSLSLVVMVHLLALDILRQREKLHDPVTLALIAAGIAYGLWRETLWNVVGSSFGITIALATCLLALAWLIFAPRPYLGLEKLFTRPAQWLDELPAPTTEAGLLALFWLISMPPAWIISLYMDPLQNTYFWHQLQGRAIGAMGPVVFIGLAAILPMRWSARLTAAFIFIWLAGFSWQAATKPTPYANALAQAQMHEAYLSGNLPVGSYKYLSGPGFVLSEQLLYYTLGQMMVLKNDRWAELQRTAITGGR